MKTYYYMTTSKGKCGCGSFTWHKGEFKTKADIKRKYKNYATVKVAYTEEEFIERYGNSLDERVQNW